MAKDIVVFVQQVEKSPYKMMRKKYSSSRFGEIA